MYSVVQGATINALDINQFYNLLTGQDSSSPVTVSNRIRAQLSGAATGTGGYVGQVNGAAPNSGTFNTGDYAVDQNGWFWICTSGGSPGTWFPAASVRFAQQMPTSGSNFTVNVPTGINNIHIKGRFIASATGTNLQLQFNGDTGSNYSYAQLLGYGSTPYNLSNSNTLVTIINIVDYNNNSSTPSQFDVMINGIQQTTGPHQAIATCSRCDGSVSSPTMIGWQSIGWWNNSSAITSLRLSLNGNSFAAGTEIDFYGYA